VNYLSQPTSEVATYCSDGRKPLLVRNHKAPIVPTFLWVGHSKTIAVHALSGAFAAPFASRSLYFGRVHAMQPAGRWLGLRSIRGPALLPAPGLKREFKL
jgi:hypothetical protein